MKRIIRNNFYLILLFIITSGLAYWWYQTYSNSPEYVLYFKHRGIIDSTHHYIVAPRYIEKRISKSDTIFNFYNKHHEYVISVPADSVKNIVLYKIKEKNL